MRAKIRSLTAPIRAAAKRNMVRIEYGDHLTIFDCSWRLKTREAPWSLTDEEGMLLYATILENKLTSGFEIATAFGYSTAYIASAFRKTGGRLTTMDCYIDEEWDENRLYEWNDLVSQMAAVRERVAKGEMPHGLTNAGKLADELGCRDLTSFRVGLSPNDVPGFIEGEKKIDFAFIDGGHFGDQPLLDYRAVEPFLASRCAVFFHDDHGKREVAGAGEAVRAAVSACAAAFGVEPLHLDTPHKLTLVSRNLDPAFLKALERFPIRGCGPKRVFFGALRAFRMRRVRLARTLAGWAKPRSRHLPMPSHPFKGEESSFGSPLRIISKTADSVVHAIEKDGYSGHETGAAVPPPAAVRYVYFKVKDPLLLCGASPACVLTMVFHDAGPKRIRVVYDSSDKGIHGGPENPPGTWKPLGGVELTGSGGWRYAQFAIEDARFEGRLNGADVRLEWFENVEGVIGGLYLKRAEPR